jgi:hypothetical protein
MEDVQDVEAGDQAVKARLAGGRGRLGKPGISGKLDRGQSGKPDGADHSGIKRRVHTFQAGYASQAGRITMTGRAGKQSKETMQEEQAGLIRGRSVGPTNCAIQTW